MAETAVALFENVIVANAVAEELRESGIASSGIRIITESAGTSIAAGNTGVLHDLKSMGATAGEIEWYRSGLERGNALVFVTGTTEDAQIAIDVMNDNDAVSIEEFDAKQEVVEPEPVVAGAVGGPNVTEKIEHHRNRTEGAKIFAW